MEDIESWLQRCSQLFPQKNRPLPLATTLQKPKGLFDVNYSINSLNGGVNEFCQKIHSC